MACGCGKKKLAAAAKRATTATTASEQQQRSFAGPTRWSGSRRTAEENKNG